jgi:hypothetical protein
MHLSQIVRVVTFCFLSWVYAYSWPGNRRAFLVLHACAYACRLAGEIAVVREGLTYRML